MTCLPLGIGERASIRRPRLIRSYNVRVYSGEIDSIEGVPMTEMKETTVPVVRLARDNDKFRKVIMTGKQTQVVLMAIPAGEEIGGEVHEGHDQLLMFVEGEGLAKIGDVETAVAEGDLSFVPSGVFHNFKNTDQVRSSCTRRTVRRNTRKVLSTPRNPRPTLPIESAHSRQRPSSRLSVCSCRKCSRSSRASSMWTNSPRSR
ncbi:MAG: cupin domain-containing protein [Gammaproteobacteria bacterium]|nr:cupin domain-containing protein [Gammaproteobacteria bacterium]